MREIYGRSSSKAACREEGREKSALSASAFELKFAGLAARYLFYMVPTIFPYFLKIFIYLIRLLLYFMRRYILLNAKECPSKLSHACLKINSLRNKLMQSLQFKYIFEFIYFIRARMKN